MVSEVAFGGVEIGMPYGIGVESAADMLPEAEAINLLRTALDAGINFFDTARMYGLSEERMGNAFQGRRSEVVLCTKCGHIRDSSGQLPAEVQLRDRIGTSLRESMAALQTDYVDVFMLHQTDPELVANETVARIFSDLKRAGTIRATGVSTYSVADSQTAIESGTWDVVQLPFNLMDQRQAVLFERAQARGVGIVVRSVLMKGLLSGRGENLHPALRDVEAHLATSYRDLFTTDCPDLATFATKFALSYPQVASVLVGMDKLTYLYQAIATADGNYLTSEHREQAQNRAYPEPEFLNLPHWHHMGWLR